MRLHENLLLNLVQEFPEHSSRKAPEVSRKPVEIRYFKAVGRWISGQYLVASATCVAAPAAGSDPSAAGRAHVAENPPRLPSVIL